MDVAALSTGLSQAKLATDVSYAVQKKAMSAAKAEGAAIVSMIQSAGQIGQAGSSDALSVAATGRGGQVDVYA